MIVVRCVGHIGTSVGASEVRIEGSDISPSELVDEVRRLSAIDDPGFTRYNTLLMVADGEAYVPAASERRVKEGDRVVLIPFSHGG